MDRSYHIRHLLLLLGDRPSEYADRYDEQFLPKYLRQQLPIT